MTRPAGARSPSLRARVTWAAGLAAALVVVLVAAASGFALVSNGREQHDRRVDAVAAALATSGARIERGRGYAATLRVDGTVTESTAVRLPASVPGLSTDVVDGNRYRVRTQALSDPPGAILSVGIRDDPARLLSGPAARRFAVAGLIAVALSAALGWLFAGRALRPMRKLIDETRALTSGRTFAADGARSAAETEELAAAIADLWHGMNNAQERTRAALESARGFAAAAAHELRTPLTAMRTDLDIVHTHHPSGAELDDIVVDLIRVQRRVESTVTALGHLAAGELSRVDERVEFDAGEVLDRVAREHRREHPDLDIAVLDGETSVIMTGWPDGIRLALDNLVRNAISHGRANRIELSIRAEDDGTLELRVDDDGVGLPVDERPRVVERFTRGSTARPGGSGLGLALVAQQAALHGGRVVLTDSPLGGLRACLVVGPPGPEPR